MVEAGAKFVFSLELSNSTHTIHANTIKEYKDKIFPIQCDIAHPPLRIRPDVIYCVNVIQHTKSPLKTLLSLAQLMGDKTVFIFNMYDRNKNSTKRLILIKSVRFITRFLPFFVWKWLTFFYISLLYLLVKIPIVSTVTHRLYPIGTSFRGDWLNLYDLGGAHYYQDFYSRGEQRKLIKEAGLKIKKQTRFGYVLIRTKGN